MDTNNESTNRELLANTVITDVSTATQYMIHRIPENATQLLTPELLPHNGLVDLGPGDFIPVPVGYTSDDLLTQELTDEDRHLAAALVAVQLSQQQKQQQVNYGLFNTQDVHSNLGNKTLPEQQVILTDKEDSTTNLTNPSGGFIRIVGTENIYIEKQLMKPSNSETTETQIRYSSPNEQQQQQTTNYTTNIKALPIKLEDDRRDSEGESLRNENRNCKKSLPHKKRISRKLKKNTNQQNQKKIICNLCEQTFNSNDEFAQHEILCQTTITPLHPASFNCQLCSESFQDQLRFFEHLKKHYEPSSSNTPISLQPQQQQSVKSKEIDKETDKQESILSSLLNLTCIDCNKTFRRQKTYEAHIRDVHSTKNTQMDEFSDTEDLMEGINVVVSNDTHSDMDDDSKHWYHEDDLQQTEEDLKELEADNGHVCHLCKQPFELRALLLQHLVTCRAASTNGPNAGEPTTLGTTTKKKAKKKGTLQCPQCDRIFSHRNSLNYHLRGHSGIRPHQCDQCGKSFFASSALKVHMRLHSGDKPYDCSECGKKFRQWGDLKYHITSLHSTEKQFQCEYCGKDFARKYSLIVHRRIHTGEKNYKCEYCGKTFRASSYLQNHRRIHTGEKPHPCPICGKPFRVRSDMKRHQKTHRGFSATVKSSSDNNQNQKIGNKLQEKVEQEQIQQQQQQDVEDEEENTAELHIEEEDEAAEHILTDYYPINDHQNSIRVQNSKNALLNELFLVTYRNGGTTTTESSNTTWISTDQ